MTSHVRRVLAGLCVWCCSPFYQCYLLEQEFDESCWAGVCLGPAMSFLAVRYRFRDRHNIQVSAQTSLRKPENIRRGLIVTQMILTDTEFILRRWVVSSPGGAVRGLLRGDVL